MLNIIKGKKVIFFDMGWTLDTPASGDWMITKRAMELIGPEKLKRMSLGGMLAPGISASRCLEEHHLTTLEEECALFTRYYTLLSEDHDLGLTHEQAADIANDRTYNMDNYVFFPDAKATVEALSKTHRLGLISDTWPSIRGQLEKGGITEYFSGFTFSCELGVWKPDPLMYLDALQKLEVNACDAVFIDDNLNNLIGAEKLGITPIHMAAGPGGAQRTPYFTIHSPGDLLKND